MAGGERVASWERGAAVPRPHLIQRLAQVLEVPAEQLLDSTEQVLDLRQLRVAAGLSARELAGRMHVSVPTLARWESGRSARPPRREVTELLARELNLPVDRVQQAVAESTARGRETARGR